MYLNADGQEKAYSSTERCITVKRFAYDDSDITWNDVSESSSRSRAMTTGTSDLAESAPRAAKQEQCKNAKHKKSGILNKLLGLFVIGCLAGAGIVGYDMYRDAQAAHLKEIRTVTVFQPANTLPVNDEGTQELQGASEQSDRGVMTAASDTARKKYDKWYRTHLSATEQKAYDRIEQGLRHQEQTIPMSSIDQDQMMRCFQYVMNDNVDIFWADESYEYMHYPSTGEVISIQPKYTFSPDERAAKQQVVDNAARQAMDDMAAFGIDAATSNDYNKARFLYGWVADYLTYDESMAEFQNLGSVCEQRVTACAGYSRLYEYLCEQVGIPCVYVTGHALVDGKDQLHAWSIMNLDGVDCYTDVTWGDKDGARATDYSWLALTSAHMSSTHTLDEPRIGVEALDGRYETWNICNTSFTIYDTASVKTRLGQSITDGWESVSLFFEDPNEYEKAYQEIAHSSYFPSALANEFPGRFPYAYTEGVYSVRKEIGLNVLTLTWK